MTSPKLALQIGLESHFFYLCSLHGYDLYAFVNKLIKYLRGGHAKYNDTVIKN